MDWRKDADLTNGSRFADSIYTNRMLTLSQIKAERFSNFRLRISNLFILPTKNFFSARVKFISLIIKPRLLFFFPHSLKSNFFSLKKWIFPIDLHTSDNCGPFPWEIVVAHAHLIVSVFRNSKGILNPSILVYKCNGLIKWFTKSFFDFNIFLADS